MVFEFHLPDIGEGVVEGEIVEWKIGEGEDIALDQPMVLVQTDKATVEIPSPRAGRVAQIRFQAGEICPVGDVLLVIDMGDEASASPAAAAAPAASGGNGASAHATVEAAASSTPPAGAAQVVDATGASARVLASPATRRLARELGVDLRAVPATGRNGRVTSDDVRGFSAAPAAPAAPASTSVVPPVAPAPAVAAPVTAPSRATGEAEERIPLRGVRRKIAEKMSQSMFTATHFTYVEEIDMTDMVAVRERAKVRAADLGVKLTYLPFIVKAIVAGLKKFPALNAALDEEKQEIVRKGYYHIGIAAQGPDGLVVTVVRDADQRSIVGLAQEIQRLSGVVQDGSIKRDELVGSTFTISSLGAMGGVLATPIINFPEVGIVGVHRMSEKPAVVNGEIVPRWLMNLSISLDHRLVDGWDGAAFLQEVKRLLEDPTLMFMEMI